jgi:hypothetical protein
MAHFEHDPPSEDDIDIGDLGFTWEEGVEVENLTPADIAMVEELSIPVIKNGLSQIGEITADFQRRLMELRVEDPKSVSRRKVRRLEHLYLTKYAIEDIHYFVYEKTKEKTDSPYISLRTDDILRNSPVDSAQIKILQNKQTFDAYGSLVDRGLNQQQIFEMTTQGDEDKKFQLRCLARLLEDRHMQDFANKLPAQALRRGPEEPLNFDEVAARAATIMNRRYLSHLENIANQNNTDSRMWAELERRDMERAMSFARPIMGLSTAKIK